MANVELREFVNYTSPPEHPDEILDWKERMKYFHDDIDWLLRLPAIHFWQQIIRDKTFSQSYDSFWQFCPRPYDLHKVPSQCLPIHNQMKKLMLLLFLRICDDTEMERFPGSSHACVIYDNFLIDVPKIIDVCSIYASAPASTKDLISKALNHIFQKQEGYWSDLDIAIETVLKTIDSVADQFALLEDISEPTPKRLGSSNSVQFSREELTDALLFLYDTFNSLVSLLSFCGSTSNVFLAHGALQRAAMVVDKYIPQLRDHFQMVFDDTQRRCFNRTKNLCIQFCDLVLKECFFKEPRTALSEKSVCHAYLDAISSLLSETKFIIEYEKRSEFSKVLVAINKDLQKEFDHSISYIQLVLKSLMPDADKRSSDGTEQPSAMAPMEGAAAAMSDDAVDSIVLQLKAMMPNENDTFLRACVVHFDCDPEKVVNHLLEENIPPILQDIRKPSSSLERKRLPFETELEKRTPGNQLPGRYYLKSEVSSKDIQDEIFQGKKAPRNYQKSSSMLSDHDYTILSGFDEYDDEYDDTYDSHNFGVMDADSGDELKDLTSRRSFVKPRVLQALEKQDQQSDKDDEGDEDEKGSESNEETDPQATQDDKKQGTQPHIFRHPQGRGRDHRRGDRQRHGNKDRQDNATKGHDDRTPRGNRGRGEYQPPRMRGRGGHTGKKHNQKSLALKKSAKGMTGF